MKEENQVIPVEVFAGTHWEASVLKSMLDDAGIQAFLKDEIRGTMMPFYVEAGGAGAVKVIVSNEDGENAKIIVADFEKNLNSNDIQQE